MAKTKARKALVIEDEDSWVDLLSLLLRDAGYQILKATSAKDALRLARSHTLDLAIVDLGLPDASGAELLKWIQELQEPRTLPVIVLSAYHKEEVSDLDLGGAAFISKDQGLPPLLATLEAVASRA